MLCYRYLDKANLTLCFFVAVIFDRKGDDTIDSAFV